MSTARIKGVLRIGGSMLIGAASETTVSTLSALSGAGILGDENLLKMVQKGASGGSILGTLIGLGFGIGLQAHYGADMRPVIACDRGVHDDEPQAEVYPSGPGSDGGMGLMCGGLGGLALAVGLQMTAGVLGHVLLNSQEDVGSVLKDMAVGGGLMALPAVIFACAMYCCFGDIYERWIKNITRAAPNKSEAKPAEVRVEDVTSSEDKPELRMS